MQRIAIALMLGTVALAGCLAPGQGLDAAALPDLSRLSQPVLEGLVKAPLEVVAPDGKRLDTHTYLPEAPEGARFPAILVLSPYYANADSVARADNIDERRGGTDKQLLDHFLPRGYAIVASSVRGTGYSEGCFTIGGPTESKDHLAVVEAILAQPWSNGAIGVYGVSYVGTTANDLLVEGHAAVRTIVPISAISDFYEYNFVDGVPINPQGYSFNAYYELGVAITPPYASPDGDTIHLAAEELGCDHMEVQRGGAESALTGDKGPYWQARDYQLEASNIHPRASVFLVHGLQDWNVKTHHLDPWLGQLQDQVPTKVWLGQWAHNRPNANSFKEEWTRGDWNLTLLRWFDHWLKGIDTGILREPMVDVQDDQGTWRHEARWPPARATLQTLHLAPGALQRAPGQGVAGWLDTGAPILAPPGPGALHYAWFVGEPREQPLRLTGTALLHLRLTHGASEGTVAATLWDVAPDGQARRINYGFLDLEHRDSLERGEAVPMGQEMQVTLRFFPQDDVVPEGHALGLTLAGNDSPLCGYAIALFRCAPEVGERDPGPLMQPVPSRGMTTALLGEGSALVLPTLDSIAPIEPPREGDA